MKAKRIIPAQVQPVVISEMPHRCPICSGNGLVPQGFYSQVTGQWASSTIEFEKCQSCCGTGIVWR
jgi:hypothetical protein